MNEYPHLSGNTIFETQRLRCRRWLPTDSDALLAVYGDPVGAQYVGDGQPISSEECDMWLGVTDRNYAQRGYGMFALEALNSSATIGFCGLVHPDNQPEVEVKYSLLRSHWGEGLASEFVPALLAYGSREFAIQRIIATVAPENLASQRVLQKSGMAFIEEQKDEQGLPMLVFAWLPA